MRISTKVAAEIAATALVASAAAVTLGATTTAGAATTCSATASTTKNDISTLGVTHTYKKTVSPTTAQDGSTVTYQIVVGTTGIG
ncbi:hypothetical protein EBN03_32815, partial [Nocardia stercoris]